MTSKNLSEISNSILARYKYKARKSEDEYRSPYNAKKVSNRRTGQALANIKMYRNKLKEEGAAITNSVGAGGIAGLTADPPWPFAYNKKRKKKKKVNEEEENRLHVDNPGGQWLKDKQDHAMKTYSQHRGTMGAVTGYYKKPIKFKREHLDNLHGARGEHKFRDHSEKLHHLEKQIGHPSNFDSKKHPIMIGVNHHGHAHVMEGNHRLAYAKKHGIDHIHAEVKYYNGGEEAYGHLQPSKVEKHRIKEDVDNPIFEGVETSMFAGSMCFDVDHDVFHNARMGKNRYHQYTKYVGKDEIGKAIREYGLSNPSAPIILKNKRTGAMMYLKYGKKNA